MVKWLALRHGVPLVTFARYSAGTAVALLIWAANGRPWPDRRGLLIHLVRGTLIAAMALSFFWAITQLPLALVLTLAFVAPLLMPPMAALFLGEPMQRRYVLAGLIAFLGVLVAAGGMPAFDTTRLLAVAAAMLAAICYAASAIVMRSRAAIDGAVLVTLLSAAVPAVLLLPLGVSASWPGWTAIAAFAALGIVGNFGVQLLARGYVHIEAQAAAVMEFTGLPWAALMGWFIFGEPVAPQTWLGAAIIMAACLFAARPQPAVTQQADPRSLP